jgi:hypothetical protein
MHISEAFPHVYAALSDALDSLGFRVRDAWVVEFLVAELKEMAAAEEELNGKSERERYHLFHGSFLVEMEAPGLRQSCPASCAVGQRVLGRYSDEPGDARFLA